MMCMRHGSSLRLTTGSRADRGRTLRREFPGDSRCHAMGPSYLQTILKPPPSFGRKQFMFANSPESLSILKTDAAAGFRA